MHVCISFYRLSFLAWVFMFLILKIPFLAEILFSLSEGELFKHADSRAEAQTQRLYFYGDSF